MNWLQKFSADIPLKQELLDFLEQYGITGLRQALHLYKHMNEYYICKTKSSVFKIHINDIYYMHIQGHCITIHAEDSIYTKYGTLNKELKLLLPFGFIKCSQNCIISLRKIKTIHHNSIILANGEEIHMSRRYTSNLLCEFALYKKKL